MKQDTESLITDLIERVRQNINNVQKLQQMKPAQLNLRPKVESWSALECIEHLNCYDRFYLPEISKQITVSKTRPEALFNSGWLGNYFANLMLPRETPKRMKTLKKTNPIHQALTVSVLESFLDGQHRLLALLDQGRSVNLNKIRTAISISRLIRLKLGDTFRFLIYHQQRHILQALKASKIQ